MNNFSLFLGAPSTRPFIYILLIADLFLRGIALYRTARKDQKVWFVALLIVNSLGVLPLVYMFLNRDSSTTTATSVPKKASKKSPKKRARK